MIKKLPLLVLLFLIATLPFQSIASEKENFKNTGSTTTTIECPTIANKTTTICSGNTFSITPTNTLPDVVPAGTTYTWTAPVISPLGALTGGAAQPIGQTSISQTLTNTTTASATATYTVTATSGTCTATFTTTVTVEPNNINTITRTSAAGTDWQTICLNYYVNLKDITYATTGATGATITGLPAGVTGSWTGNTVTISGTPAVYGDFNYTITLTGGCGNITKTGKITVNPNNTITHTSAAGTDAQTICINNAITEITYNTTSATGATIVGLPAGVTGRWVGNTVTISGTPTVAGTFTYTITLTGGCGTVTRTGTITVKATPKTTIIDKIYEPISKTCTVTFNSNGNVTSSAGVVNNTTKTITGITPGTEITITSILNGCTSEFKETIYSYNISGKVVYNVANDNCATGIALQGKAVVAKQNNTTYIGYTNKTGDYEINVPEGTYTLSVNKEVNDPTNISPQNVTMVVQGANNNYNNNFCLSNTSNEHDVAVTMYPLNDARPGFEAKYVLRLQNKDYSFVSGTFTLKYDPTKMNFTSATPTVASNTNGILTWDYSNLAPGAALEINLVMTIITPPTVNSGTVLNYVLTGNLTLTDKNPQDNEFNYNQTVVNSYDPNDKIVVEGAYINEGQAADYLHYITRFQNTGTASAINVVIKETLDSNLDWNTFEPEGTSHPGNIELKLGNELLASFPNIDLADSTTNEPASHGWIAYKIKPKAGFAIGDIAFAKSDIYFDFNAPIITNTVSTQIQLLSNPDFESNTVQLYPNPATESFSITSDQEIENITIFDLNGRKVSETKNTNSVNIAKLTSGLYLVEVRTSNGIFRKKLLKN